MIITDKALFESMTEAEYTANAASHTIDVIDDCYRCIFCEIGSWNAWKERCIAH